MRRDRGMPASGNVPRNTAPCHIGFSQQVGYEFAINYCCRLYEDPATIHDFYHSEAHSRSSLLHASPDVYDYNVGQKVHLAIPAPTLLTAPPRLLPTPWRACTQSKCSLSLHKSTCSPCTMGPIRDSCYASLVCNLCRYECVETNRAWYH